MGNVEIILTKKLSAKNPLMIEGFPGIGLVGTIAASYIVEQKNMEPVGYIRSDKFPPIAAIHDSKPLYPARIYQDKKHRFLVLFSEFVVPFSTVHQLASEILKFAVKNKVSKIVSLAGMTSIGELEGDYLYGIASTEKTAEVMKKHKIKIIKEGATTGVSGVILAQAAAENYPAMSLLSETKQTNPDPSAAVALIEKLNEMFSLGINTKELKKEAEKLDLRTRKIVEQAKGMARKYEKAESKQIIGPSYR